MHHIIQTKNPLKGGFPIKGFNEKLKVLSLFLFFKPFSHPRWVSKNGFLPYIYIE